MGNNLQSYKFGENAGILFEMVLKRTSFVSLYQKGICSCRSSGKLYLTALHTVNTSSGSFPAAKDVRKICYGLTVITGTIQKKTIKQKEEKYERR